MRGILAYGAYLPRYRLSREAIAAALGGASGKGTRSVASFDEDTTTMAVEAARQALAGLDQPRPGTLLLATTAPAYGDKTNATAVHAALSLDASAAAYDMVGAVRSAAGSLRLVLEGCGTGMAVLSDVRVGRPGGADEREGGDGAAAFVCGDDGAGQAPVLAEYLGGASATAEFLDRWRTPGELASRQWEERFGEQAYGPVAAQALSDALKAQGLTPDDIDHLAVAGLHGRAV